MEHLPDDFPENSYLAEFEIVLNNKSIFKALVFVDMFTA